VTYKIVGLFFLTWSPNLYLIQLSHTSSTDQTQALTVYLYSHCLIFTSRVLTSRWTLTASPYHYSLMMYAQDPSNVIVYTSKIWSATSLLFHTYQQHRIYWTTVITDL
jgi:hypothetical protein